MNANARFAIFLLFLFIYLLIGTNRVPLFETTEGRYAEIAREMVVNNSYLEPTLNGIKHFHKPPLAYWGMAAGMKLFGVNSFGVRFFGMFMTLIGIIATYLTAQKLNRSYEFNFNSSIILSSSLLFIICSRIVSTDIYLASFTMLALYFLFKQIVDYKTLSNALMYSFFMALGFLTKGPVIFIFTLLPYLFCKCFLKDHRKVFPAKDIIYSFIIFLIVALPWYVYVIVKNPGLLNYFIDIQTIKRISTEKFNRNEPIYFFLLIFISTFIPYIIYFVKGLFTLNQFSYNIKLLYLYIFIPLIFFSLIKSKLATYILPFYRLASIISCYAITIDRGKLFKTLSYCFLLFFHICAIVTFTIKFDIKNGPIALHILLGFWLISIIILCLLYFIIYEKFLFNASLSIFTFVFCAYLLLPLVGNEFRSYKDLTKKLNIIDPQRQYEIIVYNSFIPSISFYRNKIATMAFAKMRDTQFEDSNTYKNYYINDYATLKTFINIKKKFFLVIDPKELTNTIATYKIKCELIAKQKKHSAYFCSNS
jgi:4-amino-4-deoxy-L-arabinose transferase